MSGLRVVQSASWQCASWCIHELTSNHCSKLFIQFLKISKHSVMCIFMFPCIFWSSALHARETEDDDDVFKNVVAQYNLRDLTSPRVVQATSQFVTRSSRHTVNSAPVNSSHTRLITKSTRHIAKPPQCRAVRFNYLALMSLYHSKDD